MELEQITQALLLSNIYEMEFDMDPGTIMALISAVSAGAGALSGNKGEHGSTYSKKTRQGLDSVWDMIEGMRGGAGDITQNQNYQQGSEWLNSLYNDPQFFDKFEAPLQRQFQEQTVPDLANRFASQGSGGSLGSTGFRNQLAREGSNLSTNIAALRGGMQQQGVNQGLQYAQQPFNNLRDLYGIGTTPTNNTYQPPNAGGWGSLAAPFAQGAIQSYLNPGQAPSTQQNAPQSQQVNRANNGYVPNLY